MLTDACSPQKAVWGLSAVHGLARTPDLRGHSPLCSRHCLPEIKGPCARPLSLGPATLKP